MDGEFISYDSRTGSANVRNDASGESKGRRPRHASSQPRRAQAAPGATPAAPAAAAKQ
jgi:hypothetical protein